MSHKYATNVIPICYLLVTYVLPKCYVRATSVLSKCFLSTSSVLPKFYLSVALFYSMAVHIDVQKVRHGAKSHNKTIARVKND